MRRVTNKPKRNAYKLDMFIDTPQFLRDGNYKLVNRVVHEAVEGVLFKIVNTSIVVF